MAHHDSGRKQAVVQMIQRLHLVGPTTTLSGVPFHQQLPSASLPAAVEGRVWTISTAAVHCLNALGIIPTWSCCMTSIPVGDMQPCTGLQAQGPGMGDIQWMMPWTDAGHGTAFTGWCWCIVGWAGCV